MRLFRTHKDRVVVDGELARFRFHLWSVNKELDATINREIKLYGRGNGEADIPYETGVSRLEKECARIIAIYLPEEIQIRGFSVQYNGSVTVTFALVWAGAVSFYVLISRYDSFRRSLDRIKDDISRLLGRISRRSNVPGPSWEMQNGNQADSL